MLQLIKQIYIRIQTKRLERKLAKLALTMEHIARKNKDVYHKVMQLKDREPTPEVISAQKELLKIMERYKHESDLISLQVKKVVERSNELMRMWV